MYNTNFATNKTYRVSPAYSGNSTVEAFDSGKKVLEVIVSDYAIEGAEAVLDSFGYRLTKRIY